MDVFTSFDEVPGRLLSVEDIAPVAFFGDDLFDLFESPAKTKGTGAM